MFKKKSVGLTALLFLFLFSQLSLAQPKVVPAGDTIKPEGAVPTGAPAKAKRKKSASRSVLQAGKSFIVESLSVLSSGINSQGEKVYFRATEDVSKVIATGALVQGKITAVENNKKQGKLVIQLESVEALNGQPVDLGGDISIEGKGGQASLAVGERFTATVDAKVVVRGRAKKVEPTPPIEKEAFAEIRSKEIKANLKKGKFQNKVEVLIEPPKNVQTDDLDRDSIVMYRANSILFPQVVKPNTEKTAKGDKNKNGVTDLLLTFEGWDFIKFQPRGANTVYFKGKLKDGSEFMATAKVMVSY